MHRATGGRNARGGKQVGIPEATARDVNDRAKLRGNDEYAQFRRRGTDTGADQANEAAMMVMQGGSMTRRLMLIASAATLLLASAPAMADYLVRRPGPLQPRDLMAQGPGGRPTAAVHGLVWP